MKPSRQICAGYVMVWRILEAAGIGISIRLLTALREEILPLAQRLGSPIRGGVWKPSALMLRSPGRAAPDPLSHVLVSSMTSWTPFAALDMT